MSAEGGGTGRDVVPANAFNTLSVLHQLSLEAFLSQTSEELIFRILNRTVALCPYGRAVLWGFGDGRPRPLGVSGKSDLNARSSLMQTYADLVADIREPEEAALLDEGDFASRPERWRDFVGEQKVTSVLWLPIRVDERLVAGLWLERWSGQPAYEEKDLRMLGSLVVAYAAAWDKLVLRKPLGRRVREAVTRSRVFLLILVAVVVLLTVRLPLRIVAPCEVIPDDPVLVTAPLNGVIEEVVVEPGQRIEVGDPLFHYDARGLEEELNVARQQVRIVESDLRRAKVEAPHDPSARARLPALQNRYRQELIRLEAARERYEKRIVKADTSGMAMIDAPHEWEGRPVEVGQRVLSIVDPDRTRLLIWLPEDDNIEFDPDQPVQVFLKSEPEKSLEATLDFVAKHVTVPASGVPSFRAEALWVDGSGMAAKQRRIGLTGTAMLYGDRVSLGYWVARKPYAALRTTFGF